MIATLLAVASIGCGDQPSVPDAAARPLGGSSPIDAKDPSAHYPDGVNPAIYDNCHPFPQQGCGEGERCTYPFTEPGLTQGQFVCAPAGTVPVHGACTIDPVTMIDDCVAGAMCEGAAAGIPGGMPVCIELCDRDPGYPCVVGRCVAGAGIFADDVGLCLF